MTFYLYLTILFLNLLFVFGRSSKFVSFITLIVIVLLIGNAGPGYDFWSDYDNYNNLFESIQATGLFESIQFSFILLMKIGAYMKLDFFGLRLITTGICLFVIYKYVIKKYSYNSNYVLLLYMIYPMIVDSEQFRNFIAMTILFIAIIYLKEHNIKDKLVFFLLILVAMTIHTSFVFYFVFIIVGSRNKKVLVNFIVLLATLFSIMVILNNNQIPFIQTIIDLIDLPRAEIYLSTATKMGFLIPFILHLSSVALLMWSKNIIFKSNKEAIPNKNNYNIEKENRFVEVIFWINVISIVFFPLYIINVHFYRLSRNLLILNFIVYSNASKKIKKLSPYKFGFNLTVLLSVLLWVILDLIIKTSSDRLLIPFFEQNLFLN